MARGQNAGYANIELKNLKQRYDQMAMEQQIEIAQREQSLRELAKPFEETEDFRDFVVWLCGYTERRIPPSMEEWGELREKTKQVAAKFALAARDKARKKLQSPYQGEMDLGRVALTDWVSESLDRTACDAMTTGTTTTFTTTTGS
jgi:hypothetical protein